MTRSETELLIHLSAREVESDRVRRLLSEIIDWNRFFRAVYRNRLEGLIFDTLDRAGIYRSLPEEIRTGLESRYQRTAADVEAGLRAAGKISGRLTQNRIEHLFIRGPAAGLTLYPRPYLRPFADLDLLLKKEDVIRAAGILAKAGYGPAAGDIPDGYFLKYHLHLRLMDGDTGLPVELHWRLDHPYSLETVDYRSLISHRRTIPRGERGTPVLSRADQLICLAFHFRKHCPFLSALSGETDFADLMIGGGYLLWLADIDRAVNHLSPEEWNTVGENAEEWNLKDQVATALAAARRIYSTTLPPGWSQNKERVGMAKRIIYPHRRRILRGEQRKNGIGGYLFRPRPGTVFRPIRILDLFGYLFPPPEYIRKKYRPQNILIPLAYPIHTIRGLGLIISNLFAYLRGKISGRRHPPG